MFETFKFVYVVVIFLILYIVSIEVGGGKTIFHQFQIPFLPFFYGTFFTSSFVYNLLSCFSNIILLSLNVIQRLLNV